MIKEREKIEKIVQEALENLRPYLQMDSGDMELVEITEDNIVRVRLLGNCADCSMSKMTMKAGLEEAIREVFPEIKRVEAIDH